MRSSVSGQASTEYVGVLALIAVVLAVAATAVAAPDIPGAVVHDLKVALCIVGGDVCRDDDAKAMGLEPCVRTAEEHTQDDSLGAVIGEFERGEWAVSARSDGTWSLMALRGHGGLVDLGVPIRNLGPIVVDVGGELRVKWMSGSEWDLPEARIRDLIEQMHGHVDGLADDLVQDYTADYHGLPKPKFRYVEGGLVSDLAASIGLEAREAGTSKDLGSASGDLILGRRTGAGGDVWYFKSSASLQTLAGDLGVGSGAAVVEYHTGPPAKVVMHGTTTEGDRQTEQVLTLPLASLPRRAVAARALVSGDIGAIAEDLRAAALVERRTYRVTTDEGHLDLKLGPVGYEHKTTETHRTLIGADLLIGGRKVQRVDCLGGVDVGTPR